MYLEEKDKKETTERISAKNVDVTVDFVLLLLDYFR